MVWIGVGLKHLADKVRLRAGNGIDSDYRAHLLPRVDGQHVRRLSGVVWADGGADWQGGLLDGCDGVLVVVPIRVQVQQVVAAANQGRRRGPTQVTDAATRRRNEALAYHGLAGDHVARGLRHAQCDAGRQRAESRGRGGHACCCAGCHQAGWMCGVNRVEGATGERLLSECCLDQVLLLLMLLMAEVIIEREELNVRRLQCARRRLARRHWIACGYVDHRRNHAVGPIFLSFLGGRIDCFCLALSLLLLLVQVICG